MPTLFITFDEKSQPFKFDFSGKEASPDWNALVNATIEKQNSELPIVLYYKIKDNIDIQSLESDAQLQVLLSQSNGSPDIYLFTTKELVNKPIFQPISAFSRLGQLIEKHKSIISSNQHLSRGVGILASAIALDTNNKDFDKEFKALEKVIESRKNDGNDDDEGDEEEALRSAFQNHHLRGRGRGRGRPPGFGRGFGGKFHHGGFESPHHQHSESSSRGAFCERGRGHHFLHMMAMDDKRHKEKHKKAQACFRGGKQESSSSSPEEEMKVLQARLKNTHIHHSKNHQRGKPSSK